MFSNLVCKSSVFRVLTKPVLHVALILLSALFAYSNTFKVPFLFDDIPGILDNHLVRNIQNLWPPSGTRWFGSLTFALNYAVGGTDVFGYHVVNLAIHITASLLVYRLVVLTFTTPLLQANNRRVMCSQAIVFAPFVASSLFVSHPIQAQAVTYIVQRCTSLATLLFLASMVCYIQARLCICNEDRRTVSRVTIAWYFASLVWAVLAMKTKEIAFTLPFVIALYDYVFFPARRSAERLYLLIPVALTMLIIPFALYRVVGMDAVSAISSASGISSHDYLLTQFRVIVTYLRLLILPINQMIDHAYPLYREFSAPPVFLSFGLLLALFLASIWLVLRGRRGRISPLLCVVGFGGVWFFVTLSVESSFIPITDVMFEHRLYLPAVGAFTAAAVAGSMAVEQVRIHFPRSAAAIYVIVASVLLSLTLATHSRNRVWRSGASLWGDVLSKSPGHARALVNIGIDYVENGNTDKGLQCFQEAVRSKPDYFDAIVNLGNAYLQKGMFEESYAQYFRALAFGNVNPERRAMLLMQIGNYNLMKNETDRAIAFFKEALSIMPNIAKIHYNLGRAFIQKGMAAEAAQEFARAGQLNPERY